ncbi:MAG: hypothetical protein KGL32_07565, partial [candidate division NC10 bacterium]|nr:hypothetical protein [candidate division NC10 bacterium]
TYQRCAACPVATRTIRALIAPPSRADANLTGAVTANTNVNVQSASASIDGKNHNCDGSPVGTDHNFPAVTVPSGSSITVPPHHDDVLQCDVAGSCGGTSHSFPDSIGALLLPPGSPQWQIDAMHHYLDSIKIDPVAHPEQLPTSAFNGIIYVDGCYQRPPDNSTGILIVHHRYQNGQTSCGNPPSTCHNAGGCDDASLGPLNSNLTFKGLIIADKIGVSNGDVTIRGGIIGFGNSADNVTIDQFSGHSTIQYSKCVLDGLGQDLPSWIIPGTWHEL